MNNDTIKEKLIHCNKYSPSLEPNFILSQVGTMACFICSDISYHGLFVVADCSFNPIFKYETDAYIHACGISDNGEFAIIQTANSPTTFAKMIFINLKTNTILWEIEGSVNWKNIRSFFIDTNKRIIYVIHETYEVKYSFEGEFISHDEWIRTMDKRNDSSHYAIESATTELILSLPDSSDVMGDLKVITLYINIILDGKLISDYRIALLYKLLAEYYEKKNDILNAVLYYEKGISLNKKLPVKKKLNKLKKLSLSKA